MESNPRSAAGSKRGTVSDCIAFRPVEHAIADLSRRFVRRRGANSPAARIHARAEKPRAIAYRVTLVVVCSRVVTTAGGGTVVVFVTLSDATPLLLP